MGGAGGNTRGSRNTPLATLWVRGLQSWQRCSEGPVSGDGPPPLPTVRPLDGAREDSMWPAGVAGRVWACARVCRARTCCSNWRPGSRHESRGGALVKPTAQDTCPLLPSPVKGLLLTQSLAFHLPKGSRQHVPSPLGRPASLLAPGSRVFSSEAPHGHGTPLPKPALSLHAFQSATRPPAPSLPGHLLLTLSALPLAPAQAAAKSRASWALQGTPLHERLHASLPPSPPPGLSSDVPFSLGPPLSSFYVIPQHRSDSDT